MVVVAVKIEDIMLGGGVPLELTSYILPAQWVLITDAIHSAFQEANFWSCCCEVSICLLCFFPFVFCCHPCVAGTIMKHNVDRKLDFLNKTMFSGAKVLREQDGNILFHTDLIPVETIYVDRTNTSHTDFIVSRGTSASGPANIVPFHAVRIQGPGSYNDQSGYVSVNEPVAIPISDQPRSMIVTVPSNAGPGSVLTVSCPNGTVKSVVVPPTSGPGQELLVQY